MFICFFFFFNWGGGCLEVVFLEGRCSEGRPFFPGPKKGHCAFGTHQVGRRKHRGMHSLQYFYCSSLLFSRSHLQPPNTLHDTSKFGLLSAPLHWTKSV